MNQVHAWLKKLYNLEGVLTTLDGYEDENYRLETRNGQKYVVKIGPDLANLSQINAQNSMLSFLGETSQKHLFPKVIKSKNDLEVETVESSGIKKTLRVLTWLEGKLLIDVKHDFELFEEIGSALGKMDLSLSRLDHTFTAERDFEWDLQNAMKSQPKTHFIKDPNKRRLAEYFFLQFETLVVPELFNLRKSIIHSDPNDYNILIEQNKVSGIIDFSDNAYSPVINDLAIALAYGLMKKDNLLEWAASMVKGYNQINPLTKLEIELLYYLIAGRLTVIVTKAVENFSINPENIYLQVSEKPGWELLSKWIEINPILFESKMMDVCGYKPKSTLTNKQVLSKRQEHVNPSLNIFYDKPIQMDKAAFQYMYSSDGLTYLDCVNNISHVGHCHPRVVLAAQRQMSKLNTNTRYLYDSLNEYTAKLASKFPGPLDTVFLVNSGSEAGDLAQQIARSATGEKNTIVVDQAYHGNTMAGLEASPYKYEDKGGAKAAEHIYKLTIPDTYRGKYKADDPHAGQKYAHEIEGVIKDIQSRGVGLAAFYCESIIGCGGQVVLPQGYLETIFSQVREAGGLCIIDEVQVGFGRVGEKYWGFELQNVVPDIVVVGKPMGNGHPLAGVITTKEIANKFNNGMEYFSSFGGNPVSCAIGQEVLNIIDEEGLQQHALDTGNYFKQLLNGLAEKHSLIGDVRGYGLFLGVELVEDQKTLDPATEKAKTIIEQMKTNGILLSTDGPFKNVIKIKPPMTFNKENADRVVNTLDKVLSNF